MILSRERQSLPLRVLIAEDHFLMRKAIKDVLQHTYHISVFREAESMEQLSELIRKESFDLLITEVYVGESNILTFFPELKRVVKNKISILFFSGCREEVFAKRLMQLGADGFLNKKADETELRNAVKKVLSGEKYISGSMQYRLAEDLISGKKANPFEELTSKEFEVMLYLLQGYPLTSIAAAVHVTVSTISSHKKRLFDRLNIGSIVELTHLAAVHDVISWIDVRNVNEMSLH